jgi:transcriptional repressor NrdR
VQCPNCGGDTSILETRTVGKHDIRRRRVCATCKLRFTTREQVAAPNLRVDKRRGGVEPYDRAKLRRCLARVGKHPPLGDDAIDDLVDRIESELMRAQVRVTRWSRIVELVLDALGAVDRLAQQRMAANYLDDTGALRLDDAPAAGPRPQLGLFPDGQP